MRGLLAALTLEAEAESNGSGSPRPGLLKRVKTLWKSSSWGHWQSSECFSTASSLRVSMCHFLQISSGMHWTRRLRELTEAVISSQAHCQASVFLYQPLLGIKMSLQRLNSSRMRNFSSSENLMRFGLVMLMLPAGEEGVRMRDDESGRAHAEHRSIPLSGARRAGAVALLGAQQDWLPPGVLMVGCVSLVLPKPRRLAGSLAATGPVPGRWHGEADVATFCSVLGQAWYRGRAAPAPVGLSQALGLHLPVCCLQP